MDFMALAQECAPAVHPQTLAAIVKIESGFKPFAIGINKGTATLKRQPESKEEAVKTAKELIAGGHNIDMGLGQINSENLPRLGITVDDVFDACKNLTAAATIRGRAHHLPPHRQPEHQRRRLRSCRGAGKGHGLGHGTEAAHLQGSRGRPGRAPGHHANALGGG